MSWSAPVGYYHNYYLKNKTRLRILNKSWIKRNKKKHLIYQKLYRWKKKNKLRLNQKIRELSKKYKLEVIEKLGGKCACCKIKYFEFLCIHHRKGDGWKHRMKLKGKRGMAMYRDIIRQGCPKSKYQLLCWNCHMGFENHGKCPHKK